MTSATLTVTAKGQITLKRAFREHLGLRPGEKLRVETAPGGAVTLKPARSGAKISDAFGILHRPGQRAISIEEMDEAIMDAVADKYLKTLPSG